MHNPHTISVHEWEHLPPPPFPAQQSRARIEDDLSACVLGDDRDAMRRPQSCNWMNSSTRRSDIPKNIGRNENFSQCTLNIVHTFAGSRTLDALWKCGMCHAIKSSDEMIYTHIHIYICTRLVWCIECRKPPLNSHNFHICVVIVLSWHPLDAGNCRLIPVFILCDFFLVRKEKFVEPNGDESSYVVPV